MIFKADNDFSAKLAQEFPFLPKGKIVEYEGRKYVKKFCPIDTLGRSRGAGKRRKYDTMLFWFEEVECED